MKREIVCNTGPILGLAIIRRLDLFRDLFDDVFVPEEVHEEILEGGVKGVGLGSYKKRSGSRLGHFPLHLIHCSERRLIVGRPQS